MFVKPQLPSGSKRPGRVSERSPAAFYGIRTAFPEDFFRLRRLCYKPNRRNRNIGFSLYFAGKLDLISGFCGNVYSVNDSARRNVNQVDAVLL